MRMQAGLARVMLPLAVAAMFATGCSSSGSGGDEAGGGSSDPQDAALSYAKCMREHGIDVPDPKVDGDGGEGLVELGPGGPMGGDAEAFEEAQEACAEYLADMGGEGPIGTLTEADKEQMLKFAECMREHGIDMPDPDFSSHSGGALEFEVPPGSQGNEDFEAATEACQEFMGPPDGSS